MLITYIYNISLIIDLLLGNLKISEMYLFHLLISFFLSPFLFVIFFVLFSKCVTMILTIVSFAFLNSSASQQTWRRRSDVAPTSLIYGAFRLLLGCMCKKSDVAATSKRRRSDVRKATSERRLARFCNLCAT